MLYSACSEEKLRLRICTFYLQTFSSALSWSLPSFISCSMPITKTSFSVFVGSLDWHWGARARSRPLPGWKTPVRFGKVFLGERQAFYWWNLWVEVRSIPTATHIPRVLILNAEVPNGTKCHFYCTWNCGFEREWKSEDSGELESRQRPLVQRLKIQLLFIRILGRSLLLNMHPKEQMWMIQGSLKKKKPFNFRSLFNANN